MRDPLRAIARHLAQVGASTSVGARWEDNPRNIAKHYLKTWFALDLISYAAITPTSAGAFHACCSLTAWAITPGTVSYHSTCSRSLSERRWPS